MTIAARMRRHKLPKCIRWTASDIVEADYKGQRMWCGLITNDIVGPKIRRAFAEVAVPLDADEATIGKIIERAVVDLAQQARAISG
jgi:hypothetical protein